MPYKLGLAGFFAACAVFSLPLCAQDSPASMRPAVHAWGKASVIEEISPATLAQVAAMRRQYVAGIPPSQPALSGEAMSAASVSSPPSIAENSSPLAAPTANQIDSAEPPAPELLASLRPLEFNSTPVESNVLPGNRLLADGLEYAHFPYTARQKFHLFVKDIYDPFAFAGEQFDALYNQAQGNPSDFGGGMQGYGLRLAAIYATDTTGEFFGTFLFPSILHTDPRYFRLGRGGFFHRAGYALTRILIVRKDDGGETFNTARWLTGFATTAVSDSYYPHRDRNMYGVMHHAAVNIGFDALDELFREFWPDIAHRLHVPAFVVRRTADPYFPDQQTKP